MCEKVNRNSCKGPPSCGPKIGFSASAEKLRRLDPALAPQPSSVGSSSIPSRRPQPAWRPSPLQARRGGHGPRGGGVTGTACKGDGGGRAGGSLIGVCRRPRDSLRVRFGLRRDRFEIGFRRRPRAAGPAQLPTVWARADPRPDPSGGHRGRLPSVPLTGGSEPPGPTRRRPVQSTARATGKAKGGGPGRDASPCGPFPPSRPAGRLRPRRRSGSSGTRPAGGGRRRRRRAGPGPP